MDNAVRIAQSTLETLLFAQTLRPLAERAGPAADFCVDSFARTLATSMENNGG